MNIALWIVQLLLGLVFLAAGYTKSSKPRSDLQGMMPWVEDFSDSQVKGIGILELLAGLGLILPSVTKILPILTPLAAIGLVLTMLGAIYTHYRRQEYGVIGANVVLLVLAAFVAYGRLVLEVL